MVSSVHDSLIQVFNEDSYRSLWRSKHRFNEGAGLTLRIGLLVLLKKLRILIIIFCLISNFFALNNAE